ncbi:MAG: DUF1566 domain-containing protein [Natronospirillum sp.]|uniref:Lcl C-terminal domain-containing protein n=1 Tax=Natronospirillum sp. TaxID=2812955 RepID=UPI0025DDC98C|nr:DUF1566 domain-containing protein [Natronospirillum sp.]MCH8552396.1 DUF1566 domain-containing protein [Natronospirillum sp.]
MAQEAMRDSDEFMVHDNGTVTDQRLNLMWSACAAGMTWDAGSCVGEPLRLNWNGARHAARNSTLGGHDNWRLPTIQELRDLVHCSSGRRQGPDNTDGGYRCDGGFASPTIVEDAFPDTPEEMFWSYSPSLFLSFGSMGVFFRSGGSFHRDREDLYLVRWVRDLD